MKIKNEQIAEFERQIEKLRVENSQLKTRLQMNDARTGPAKMDKLLLSNNYHLEQIRHLNEELANAENKNNTLQKQFNDALIKLKLQEKDIKRQRERSGSDQQKIEKLQSENLELRRVVDDLTVKLDQKSTAIAKRDEGINQLNLKNEAFVKKIEYLENNSKEIASKMEDLNKHKLSLEKQVGAGQKLAKDLEAQLVSKSKALEETNEKLENCEQMNEDMVASIEQAREEFKEVSDLCEELTGKNKDLDKQLNHLGKVRNNLELELEKNARVTRNIEDENETIKLKHRECLIKLDNLEQKVHDYNDFKIGMEEATKSLEHCKSVIANYEKKVVLMRQERDVLLDRMSHMSEAKKSLEKQFDEIMKSMVDD